MFRIIIVCATFFLSLFFSSQIGFAACPGIGTGELIAPIEFLKGCSAGSSDKAVLKDIKGTEGIKEFVILISERVIQFGALFAIGAIVYAGIRYTTSVGDDEKIKGAKNTLLYAIIGLFILLLAFPFVDVIIGFIYSLGS